MSSCWRNSTDSCRLTICRLPAMWFSIAPGDPLLETGFQHRILRRVCSDRRSLAALSNVPYGCNAWARLLVGTRKCHVCLMRDGFSIRLDCNLEPTHARWDESSGVTQQSQNAVLTTSCQPQVIKRRGQCEHTSCKSALCPRHVRAVKSHPSSDVAIDWFDWHYSRCCPSISI